MHSGRRAAGDDITCILVRTGCESVRRHLAFEWFARTKLNGRSCVVIAATGSCWCGVGHILATKRNGRLVVFASYTTCSGSWCTAGTNQKKVVREQVAMHATATVHDGHGCADDREAGLPCPKNDGRCSSRSGVHTR